MLLKMEELPQEKEERPEVYLPPALPLPFRFEHTTTTVNDLIEALEKALTERSSSSKPKIPLMPPPIPDFMDVDRYLLEIEDRSEELYQKIAVKYRQQGSLRLTELVNGLEWLDVIRVFMMLLFLAQRLKLSLMQPEDETDIFIEIEEEG
jgi:chromatin segregation and condensation protein Rec8/ScpA/Scc1 (kleisin family)